jgi:DNA-binding XRE family transcriptional regulator
MEKTRATKARRGKGGGGAVSTTKGTKGNGEAVAIDQPVADDGPVLAAPEPAQTVPKPEERMWCETVTLFGKGQMVGLPAEIDEPLGTQITEAEWIEIERLLCAGFTLGLPISEDVHGTEVVAWLDSECGVRSECDTARMERSTSPCCWKRVRLTESDTMRHGKKHRGKGRHRVLQRVEVPPLDALAIGRRIRRARLQERFYDLRQLAQVSGIGYSTLSSYEHGHRVPCMLSAIKLARALRHRVDYLLFGLRKTSKSETPANMERSQGWTPKS